MPPHPLDRGIPESGIRADWDSVGHHVAPGPREIPQCRDNPRVAPRVRFDRRRHPARQALARLQPGAQLAGSGPPRPYPGGERRVETSLVKRAVGPVGVERAAKALVQRGRGSPCARAAPRFVVRRRRSRLDSPRPASGGRHRVSSRDLACERARCEPCVELRLKPAQKFRARCPRGRERAVRRPFPHRRRRDPEPVGHLPDRQCPVHGTSPQCAHHLDASFSVGNCKRRGERQKFGSSVPGRIDGRAGRTVRAGIVRGERGKRGRRAAPPGRGQAFGVPLRVAGPWRSESTNRSSHFARVQTLATAAEVMPSTPATTATPESASLPGFT